MTFVPKKKSDSRSTTASNSTNTAATSSNVATNNNNNNNKSNIAVASAVVAPKDYQQDPQPDGQHYVDLDQQQQQLQQYRRSPQMQCSTSGAGDRMNQDEVNYSGYDVNNGEEHNHDRRHHHHHHHHHNNHHHGHHQLQNKYMNPKGDNQSNINHVILITVINPHYPITCDLIHQICSNYGKVNRIVIFKKNGVQAMVEFDNIESAKRARAMLHGCDIYSGCCTLKIEFAKPSRLNVHKNDSESFDYTNPNLGAGPPQLQSTSESGHNDNHHQQQHHPHHLQQTSSGGHHASYLHGMNPHHPRGPGGMDRRGANLGGIGGDVGNAHSSTGGHNHHHHHANQFHHPPHMHQPLSGHHPHSKQSMPPHALSGSAHQGTVLMVYGLSVDRVNCDRLFNLFCLYGNVVRVKFLRTKEGCAMVQMGDVLAVDRCFSSLNKTILFGNELQISYSKQAFLHDVMQPFTLPDGSPSFKDFMGNKNNRFRNPEVASKNRILPPSPVLHFFNAPFGISEDELLVLFKQTTSYEPVSLKIFPPKVDNAKSFSGLVTFRDPAEATEALVLCNHLSIPKVGVPHPYILRLCFSPPTYC